MASFEWTSGEATVVAALEVDSAVELLSSGAAAGKKKDAESTGKLSSHLSSSKRSSNRRRGKKNWAYVSQEEISRDAEQAACDPDAAKGIVNCVTTFAMSLCVVIVAVKAWLFVWTQDAAIKTSMLDSVGDGVAFGILKYTACRMARQDFVAYPDGQYRFESVAVFIFSIFMFTLMFQQAWGSSVSLLNAFLAPCQKELARTLLEGLPLAVGACDEAVKKVYFEKDDDEIFTICVLYVDAAYKLCLALYCYLYAIPKTGSDVLRAIAADRRNDFFLSVSLASLKLFARSSKPMVGRHPAAEMLVRESNELLALGGSLVLSCLWASSAAEQAPMLTSEGIEEEAVADAARAVEEVLRRDGSGLSFTLDLCHLSGEGGLAELHLKSCPSGLPYARLDEVKQQLSDALEALDAVSRTVILVE